MLCHLFEPNPSASIVVPGLASSLNSGSIIEFFHLLAAYITILNNLDIVFELTLNISYKDLLEVLVHNNISIKVQRVLKLN